VGIDVLGVIQVRQGDRWKSLATYYQGQRGLIRYWLGWGGGGWHSYHFGVKPLVSQPRGLPPDFWPSSEEYVVRNLMTKHAIGTQDQSWVDAREVLDALPLLGHRTCLVPIETARALSQQNASPAAWISSAGVCEGVFCFDVDGKGPRLLSVTPEWQAIDSETGCVYVECAFEFFEGEVEEFLRTFTDHVQAYSSARLVYGFE
jgi:hypothetical protein